MPIHRLVCVGVNFRTAPVEYREKLGSDLPVRCEQVCGCAQAESNGDGEAIRELAWLSTCNRVELYALVGDWFGEARVARGLRESLARTFFVGSTGLGDAWSAHIVRLHGLWEEHASEPAAIALEIGKSKDPADVLPKWAKRFDKDSKRNAKARTRVATLDWDRRQVRGVLVRILEEYGAMQRTERPAPKQPEKPTAGG